MTARNAQQSYAAGRKALLAAISKRLEADGRFPAAWLTGSFGRGEADALSDLDLSVVVADSASQQLCDRGDPAARRALFEQFGQAAVIHEAHHNAPAGGTFTFVLYAKTAVAVDWVLVPQATAQRPAASRLLFAHQPIPPAPSTQQATKRERLEQAAEKISFFWMMAAVTAKYWLRGDAVFVVMWLEALAGLIAQVEQLIAGDSWPYHRGSRTALAATPAEQDDQLRALGEQMVVLGNKLTAKTAWAVPHAQPEVHYLLSLRQHD